MSPYPLRTLRMLASAAVLATNLLTLPAAGRRHAHRPPAP
ncbi:hypothetical protein ABIB07_001378 [Bradyrhizobium sp. RT10b]